MDISDYIRTSKGSGYRRVTSPGKDWTPVLSVVTSRSVRQVFHKIKISMTLQFLCKILMKFLFVKRW